MHWPVPLIAEVVARVARGEHLLRVVDHALELCLEVEQWDTCAVAG
jgi:hypothetical protein